MKITEITLDIWKWQGCVCVGGRSTDFATWAKKYVGAAITTGPHAVGHAYVEMGAPWLIWIASLRDVTTLAHEALHATAGILEGRGLTYAAASEEAYTYTMEYIMKQTLHAKKWRAA